MIAYTIFYKFYEDRKRKPSNSDIFDIVISALIPNMDSVNTENNQAEVLKKIKNIEKSLLVNVQIFMPKEFRELSMLPSLRPIPAPP